MRRLSCEMRKCAVEGQGVCDIECKGVILNADVEGEGGVCDIECESVSVKCDGVCEIGCDVESRY